MGPLAPFCRFIVQQKAQCQDFSTKIDALKIYKNKLTESIKTTKNCKTKIHGSFFIMAQISFMVGQAMTGLQGAVVLINLCSALLMMAQIL